jgi:O-acetyl-ADP-ribose deacetylase (regulator of RNase III)
MFKLYGIKIMIEYIQNGNIFDSKCEALVNPINCVGVMGKGLAKQFKEKFPTMFVQYKTDCQVGLYSQMQIRIYNYDTKNPIYKYIVCFPTKYYWKDASKYLYIVDGLKQLCIFLPKIKSIAIPKLGCGLGELDWNIVKVLIEEQLKDSNCLIKIYE